MQAPVPDSAALPSANQVGSLEHAFATADEQG
jgi:hypothetical protein